MLVRVVASLMKAGRSDGRVDLKAGIHFRILVKLQRLLEKQDFRLSNSSDLADDILQKQFLNISII